MLPFPGSLVFFGAPPYLELQRDLALAGQIPLLQSLFRHEAPNSIRIPQSGWLHEARPGDGHEPHVHGPVRDTFRRSHRWQRIHRHEDELAVVGTEDKLTHVLLSTAPDDISLYNKPMAFGATSTNCCWMARRRRPMNFGRWRTVWLPADCLVIA